MYVLGYEALRLETRGSVSILMFLQNFEGEWACKSFSQGRKSIPSVASQWTLLIPSPGPLQKTNKQTNIHKTILEFVNHTFITRKLYFHSGAHALLCMSHPWVNVAKVQLPGNCSQRICTPWVQAAAQEFLYFCQSPHKDHALGPAALL